MEVLRYGIFFVFITLFGCTAREVGPQYPGDDSVPSSRDGIWILCEGNFGWGNGSLGYYDPVDGSVFHQVFQTVNGRPLGDVVQHMSIHEDEYFITINNSNKIEVINALDLSSKRTLGPYDSPRRLLFSDNKGFLSSIWSKDLRVIDPLTGEVLKRIPMGGWTEKMILMNGKVHVQVRNGEPGIKVIDPTSMDIIGQWRSPHEVISISDDGMGNLWACGDKAGNVILYKWSGTNKLDSLETQIPVAIATRMTTYSGNVFLLNDQLFKVPANLDSPLQPFITHSWSNPYSIMIDDRGIFITDALDFVRNGVLYYFSHSGNQLDSAELRIIPGFMATLQP